jgi:hypothetical protein
MLRIGMRTAPSFWDRSHTCRAPLLSSTYAVAIVSVGTHVLFNLVSTIKQHHTSTSKSCICVAYLLAESFIAFPVPCTVLDCRDNTKNKISSPSSVAVVARTVHIWLWLMAGPEEAQPSTTRFSSKGLTVFGSPGWPEESKTRASWIRTS